MIAKYRSKVLQNAPEVHSVMLSTSHKLPVVIKIFILSILSGRFTQFLLYIEPFVALISTNSEDYDEIITRLSLSQESCTVC